MDLPVEIEILRLVTERLDKLGILYMLSGSVAASFFAQPRMTRDIDIVIELVGEQVPRVVEAFAGDFYIDEDDAMEAVSLQGMFNIIHYQAVVKVDFIIRKDSPYRKLEFQRRVRKQVMDFPLWVVSPEDLIISKLFWAKESVSELQMRDVTSIVTHRGDKLDREYIGYWAKELGIGHLWEVLKHE
ncbi:MAG: nucleotidyl transferase AbiEii/AbiGii toxin family protein [Syntrophomonas sp.]|nr:nucleotidyl transferase AbiEii/AbiGii toxin family protein [Syntrophomonas sp.]